MTAGLGYDTLFTAPGGLGIQRGVLSMTPELFVWRLRAGVGTHAGFVSFSRVSGSGNTPWAPILGFHATLAADLFTIDRLTVLVAARGDVGTLSALGVSGGVRYAF